MDITDETDDTNAPRAETDDGQDNGGAAEAAATGAAAATRQGEEARPADFAHAGAAFTDWFNRKLGELPNASVRLGTKNATALRLHPDGRLECSLHASAGEQEQAFVAFEASYLDQLVRRIAAIGL